MAPKRKSPAMKEPASGKSESRPAPPPAESLEPVAEPASPGPLPFPVVGVGASAGGLEAYTQLLNALPDDTGLAFVLVSHLSPTHASMLAEILGRATRMPVTQVADEAAVQPNQVYVIPPDRSMVIRGGRLILEPRSQGPGAPRPIDQFFRSLAEDQWHQAIGVILSGTANDGTMGLQEIKAYGGLSFAQDETAQHDGMPRSAIASGHVDFVLSPEGIAAELTRISRHSHTPEGRQSESEKTAVAGILQAIHHSLGVDFSNYKINTIARRITRRMALMQVDSYKEYLHALKNNRPELEALYQDILINVTSFFRNPEGYNHLKQQVLPSLLLGRERNDPLRIWVMGCSTGEEAYSIAIVLAELAEQMGRINSAQVFATDLNSVGIDKARAGIYARNITDHVSPERLRRFFHEIDGGYRVSKAIRETCVFARHDALRDPPFSRIDMVSCRNVLIYLEQSMQQRMLPLLHYSLEPGGILWLGHSESIGSYRELFEVQEPKLKFYRKKIAAEARTQGNFPIIGRAKREEPVQPPAGGRPAPSRALFDLQKEADRLLVTRYAPPGVLVNGDLEILQFRGEAGRYLTPAQGKASLNLLKMLREGLMLDTRSAMTRARKEGVVVRKDGIKFRLNGRPLSVGIEVVPVRSEGADEGVMLVLFHEEPRRTAKASPLPRRSAAQRTRTEAEAQLLKQELSSTREYLQSVIEQQEAANEELQSANEEVQSANEELQSINEELETSKEELQSSSEELATVNDELQNRNFEMGQTNNDLMNLLSSVQMAIVMLGPDQRIRRFTPTAERMLNLISTDIGRPISDIKLRIDVPDLEELVAETMESVSLRQREVLDRNGRWHSLRIRPYRTTDNRIDGAVLMLVDIDSLKRTEMSLRSSEARLRVLQDQAPIGIYELDRRGQFQRVNDRFLAIAGRPRESLIGRRAQEIVHPDDLEASEAGLTRLLIGELPYHRLEKRVVRPDGVVTWVDVRRFAVREGVPDDEMLIVGMVEDVTERKMAEQTAMDREQRFRELADNTPALMWIAGPDGYEFVNRAYLTFLGVDESQVLGLRWIAYIYPEDRDGYLAAYQQAVSRHVPFEQQFRYRNTLGEYRWMMSLASPRYDLNGQFTGHAGTMFDITAMKQAESFLLQADEAKNNFIALLAHELRNPLAALMNAAELALARNVAPEKAEQASAILRRQLASLNRMVDDLLDASRVTQGKIKMQKERIELQPMIVNVVETLRTLTADPTLSIEVTMPDTPIVMAADPLRLEQILGNVLGNAIKFSSPPRRIRVTVEQNHGSKDVAEIRILDNGQGIDGDTLPRVFDLFVQGDSTSHRRHSGLGIGLALVKRLVELHGGSVKASSGGEGHGSEFIIRLPTLR